VWEQAARYCHIQCYQLRLDIAHCYQLRLSISLAAAAASVIRADNNRFIERDIELAPYCLATLATAGSRLCLPHSSSGQIAGGM
jgi:hypothetical protein